MPQSLANVYTHIIFSTKHRIPLIDDQVAPELYRYLGNICNGLDCIPLKIGGHYDHIHILNKLSRKTSIVTLLEETKRRSSKWMKKQGPQYANFYWQDGYAIFSVDPQKTDAVSNYIARQKEHHAKRGFQDECRLFFRKYKVDYDERYVWD